MIRKVLYVFDKRQKFHLVMLYFIILIGTALEMVGLAGILAFVNALMDPESFLEIELVQMVYKALRFSSVNSFIIFVALGLMGVYVAKNAFLIIMNKLQYRFVLNNQHRLSIRMLNSYIYEPYSFHTAHNSADLRNNIVTDVELFFLVITNMLMFLSEATVCAVLIITMLIVDKSITIGLVLFMGVILLAFARVYKEKVDYYGKKRRENAILMNKWLDQALGGIKEIKILNREPFFTGKYEKVNYKYAESRKKYYLYSLVPKPIIETASIAAIVLVVSVKLARGVAPEYFVNTLYVFALAAYRMLPSVSKIASYLSNIMYNAAAVDALYQDMIEIEGRQDKAVKESSKKEKTELSFNREVEIRNLSFCYPDGEENVLSNISFSIPKNVSVAFVGPSGAGKTTLADIILGVLTPQEGSVYVDGIDVFANMDAWHRKLAYIPQNIYMMDDTIRNNVAFGIEEADIRDEDIWKALEDAQLADFVRELENGLDTTIGERGVRFSGGQRQRIGIARALYRNSEILVLDEATSALDNETEKAVMEAIDNLAGKKTLIIIAHRLTTIQNCDIIYEIKEGDISVIE